MPWELLVKDVPEDKHHDLDYLVDQLDWERNVDPELQGPPLPRADRPRRRRRPRATSTAGSSTARSTASSSSRAKELTVEPGVKVTIKDNGAYGLIAVQGSGTIGKHRAADAGHDPLRRDDRGRGLRQPRGRPGGRGLREHRGEPLVSLRYFGPERPNPAVPAIGSYKRSRLLSAVQIGRPRPGKIWREQRGRRFRRSPIGQEQFESIEKTHRRIRQGKESGRIIDSIEKSRQRDLQRPQANSPADRRRRTKSNKPSSLRDQAFGLAIKLANRGEVNEAVTLLLNCSRNSTRRTAAFTGTWAAFTCTS